MGLEEVELVKSDKKDKVYWFKLFCGLILGLAWVILIVIKLGNPSFSLKIPFIVTGILTGAFAVSFIAKKFVGGKKEDINKIPDPISEDEVIKILYKTVQGSRERDYKDGFFRNLKSFGRISPTYVNKNLIYTYAVTLSDKIEIEGIEDDKLLISINANYPKNKPSVRSIKITEHKLKEQINLSSSNPKEDPDEEERTETDLSTGKQTTYKKKLHPKEVKKEQKEGEVV